MAQTQWFFPRGALGRDGWETRVDHALPWWSHTGLRIGRAGHHEIAADAVERMVIPLDARVVTIEHSGGRVELTGRASVFDGAADVAYLGIDTAMTIEADGSFAVAEAPATESLPVAVIRAADVPVEDRGTAAAARQVRNFGTPGALAAQKLIVCEVVTPAGNWSSYPPHKHDTEVPGHESNLEEIYYFEVAGGGFGLFDSDVVTERVHSGDVALIPRGYHGPAAAEPGHALYYLNVMAGPGAHRVWLITAQEEPR